MCKKKKKHEKLRDVRVVTRIKVHSALSEKPKETSVCVKSINTITLSQKSHHSLITLRTIFSLNSYKFSTLHHTFTEVSL